MPHHHVITRTGSIRAIPVLEMTMGQDPEVTVIVMAMVEDESPGVTWIGPVRAPIEILTTVTVRLNLKCGDGVKRGSTQTTCFAPGKGLLRVVAKKWKPQMLRLFIPSFPSNKNKTNTPTRNLFQAVSPPKKVLVIPLALSKQPTEIQYPNYSLNGIQSKPRKVHLLNNDVPKGSECAIVNTAVG